MPDLVHSLRGHDLGHLRIVADAWGVELQAKEPAAASEELAAALLQPDLLDEVIEALPAEAGRALWTLIANGGRLLWAEFARQYGEIRPIGPGRRDREAPQHKPASPAETLYFRALLARAFFDTHGGPQEHAYLPDDLLARLRPLAHGAPSEAPLGRPATPAERAHVSPANDHILDHAATLLAALRLGIDPPFADRWPLPAGALRDLLTAAGLIKDGAPQSAAVRAHLAAARGAALAMLVRTWLSSQDFNELRLVPGLVCEGEWSNDPLAAREFLLARLRTLPAGKWWSLAAFLSDLKEQHAGFQRPAGNFDAWLVRREADGESLRGFAHWDEVDGGLVRFVIAGPMCWLGLAETASTGEGGPVSAFRLTPWSAALLAGKPPRLAEEGEKARVASTGRLRLARLVPRAVRYQIARFGLWEREDELEYVYRLTPASLERARAQGLTVEQLLVLLGRHAGAPVPPALMRALQGWEQSGAQARLETVRVLRLPDPQSLERLRKSRAARFLGDPLGPVSIIVKPGAEAKVLEALAELGILAEDLTKADIIASDN